jgi:lipid-binding SYLF domain-containing protein
MSHFPDEKGQAGMRNKWSGVCLAGLLMVVAGGCSTAPKSTAERADLQAEVELKIAEARTHDPDLKAFFDTAAGYAVFPSVGKGGFVVGGAYGRGVLYERGKPIAYCDLTQASIGAQAGGQSYTELIFFETPQALGDFKSGDFTLNAEATAVALKSGAGANARYSNAIAVFTMDPSGLMGEAAVGGQKFNVAPLEWAQ